MPSKSDLFEEKKKSFEEGEKVLQKTCPIKTLKKLPKMPGLTKKTARFLRLKSMIYLLKHDEGRIFQKYFLKKPFTYGTRLFLASFKKQKREGDFFLCGINSIKEFPKLVADAKKLFVLGFSYCHKPFECPSGRFTDQCSYKENHPVCGQCFIGKCRSLSKNTHLLFIPTVHYIGEKMMELVHKNPDKKVIFLITACEMSLKMFHDWGKMLGIQGIGVRLDGRICNTMQAFILSEKGIKPGLTVVLKETQKKMLEWIKIRTTGETALDDHLNQKRAPGRTHIPLSKDLGGSSRSQDSK